MFLSEIQIVSSEMVVGEVGDAVAQPDNAAVEMTLQNQWILKSENSGIKCTIIRIKCIPFAAVAKSMSSLK